MNATKLSQQQHCCDKMPLARVQFVMQSSSYHKINNRQKGGMKHFEGFERSEQNFFEHPKFDPLHLTNRLYLGLYKTGNTNTFRSIYLHFKFKFADIQRIEIIFECARHDAWRIFYWNFGAQVQFFDGIPALNIVNISLSACISIVHFTACDQTANLLVEWAFVGRIFPVSIENGYAVCIFRLEKEKIKFKRNWA